MIVIKDRFIKKEEIRALLDGMDSEISTRDLSIWLKSRTDNEFVIAPRNFVETTVSFFEIKAEEMKAPLSVIVSEDGVNEMIEDFKTIKKYL